MDYKDYLQSDHWKQLAEETKRLAGYRCQVCYSSGELHAHHRTYERKGDELQSDLIALCADCHSLFHGKVDLEENRLGDLLRGLDIDLPELSLEIKPTEAQREAQLNSAKRWIALSNKYPGMLIPTSIMEIIKREEL